MKLKLTVVYGEDICVALKEAYGCDTDMELLGVFKGVMKETLDAEKIAEGDLSIKCELLESAIC